ncbi:MAG TPA: ABC transporter substrate-binding protein [Chloroflexota bacterium]|nr:ABC transporter substrate-binding protein [Chloroflexota bacterium]
MTRAWLSPAGLLISLLLGACGSAPAAAPASSNPSTAAAPASSAAAKPVASTAPPTSAKPATSAAPASSAAAAKPATSAVASVAAGEKPELDHVTLMYPTLSGELVYGRIAEEKGFFQKYGVDVNVLYAESNTAIASLVSNQAQFALSDGVLFLNGVASGSPLKIIANVDSTIPYGLFSQTSIAKPEDLKGKSLAVGQIGDATYLAARLALAPYKLALNTDVQLFPGGNSPARFAALASGQVAAAMLDQDAFGKQAEAKGAHLLISLRDQNPPWIGGGVVTTTTVIKNDPKTTLAVLKGLLDGIGFFSNDQNRAESLAIMAKDLKAQPNDALVTDAYASYHQRSTSGPAVKAADIDATLEGLRSADATHYANIKSSDIIDSSFTDQLKASGFIK